MESKPELKYMFSNINEWLKFAETKHAGLIILNTALVIGILSSYGIIKHCLFKPSIVVGIVCFGLSVFISIISQFPVTQNAIFRKKVVENPNLYFFEHLANFEVQDLINNLEINYDKFNPTKLDCDLMNQILVNARITQTKFTLFKYSSYVCAFGFGIIGISSLIKILCHF
jgi:hypothetical protein